MTIRRWLSRDTTRILVLLVWALFVVAIVINVFDVPLWRATSLQMPKGEAAGAAAPVFNREARYKGSIFFMPDFGDICWERMLDNRTGRMWDKGYVSCDSTVSELVDNKKRGAMPAERMESISKAFQRDP
jgi:hypothetical protein